MKKQIHIKTLIKAYRLVMIDLVMDSEFIELRECLNAKQRRSLERIINSVSNGMGVKINQCIRGEL